MNGTWRSNLPVWARDLPSAPRTPPDEPDGPCMHAGCPRTGTAVTGDLVACGYHRGEESTKAGTRTTGHRPGDQQ